jgi:hypothetical protein
LSDADEAVVDLTGAAVRFIMARKGATDALVDEQATIVDADEGIVKYSWASGDTATIGKFIAEWEVTFLDGRSETFPNSTYLNVKITNDLGGIDSGDAEDDDVFDDLF